MLKIGCGWCLATCSLVDEVVLKMGRKSEWHELYSQFLRGRAAENQFEKSHQSLKWYLLHPAATPSTLHPLPYNVVETIQKKRLKTPSFQNSTSETLASNPFIDPKKTI
jgi:hypothetical protein